MSYIRNITDKQQTDIERVADSSAIRFAWFDGKVEQSGVFKAIPAYDAVNQGNTGEARSDVVKTRTNIIGSHNDKPHLFENPGKA
jgi:hypothetical protein